MLGIDQILDMGRTTVNLIGNCVATAVVAKWEKVFDYEKMNKFILDKNNKNDLKEIKELKPKKRLEFNYAENDDYIIR